MNRYYLADMGTTPAQKNQRVNFLRSLLPNGPTRTATQDQLHWSEATDKRYYLAQAETSEDEHSQLIGQAWVTTFTDVDAVHAYKLTTPTLWWDSGNQPQSPP